MKQGFNFAKDAFNKASNTSVKHEVILKFIGGIGGGFLGYKYFKDEQKIKEKQLIISEEANNIRKESNQIKLKQIELLENQQKVKLLEVLQKDITPNIGDTVTVNNQIIKKPDELNEVTLSGEENNSENF